VPVAEALPVGTTSSGEEALLRGKFTHPPGHPGAGTASVYQTDTNQIIRLIDFKSTTGPNLFVYLATDKSATEFINLGLLKSTGGDQNYDIPTGVKVTDYPCVLV